MTVQNRDNAITKIADAAPEPSRSRSDQPSVAGVSTQDTGRVSSSAEADAAGPADGDARDRHEAASPEAPSPSSRKREAEAQAETASRDGAPSKESSKKVPVSARKTKNNVRKLRNERMMSKAELARRAGISVLTVDRVERGMSCRMDTKRKLLEALGLRPQDRVMVFGDEDE
jgi:DNA-binding XRE family transcriptional regulator